MFCHAFWKDPAHQETCGQLNSRNVGLHFAVNFFEQLVLDELVVCALVEIVVTALLNDLSATRAATPNPLISSSFVNSDNNVFDRPGRVGVPTFT